MDRVIEAVYEHGVLRPKHPLDLTEGTEVRLTVRTVERASVAQRTYGKMAWTGSIEELDRLAHEPLDVDEES